MPARRIEAGPLLVLLGAVVLLVSLFLDWYAPGLTAWDAFELLDLVLAAVAIGAGLAAVAQLGALALGPDPRALPWLCATALVLVLATVIQHPPVVGTADTETGLWLAFAATLVMALGALLVAARVRISFDIEARRRRVSAVETRRPRATGDDEDDAIETRPPRATGNADDVVETRRPRTTGDDDAVEPEAEEPAARRAWNDPENQ